MTDPFFYDYNLTPVSPAGSLNESGTVQITAPVGAARLQELLSGLQSGQTLHARILSLETDGAGNRYARMDLGENLSVTARCNGNLSVRGKSAFFSGEQKWRRQNQPASSLSEYRSS